MPSVDPAADPPPARGGAYDYDGVVYWEYSPELDHDPDPGEVVWTWVAFEDDPSIGKDRPVAVVGRTDDRRLVAFMLSSKDHDDDRDWISIGTGPWDREGRESWVRRDRVLAVRSDSVRREGAIIPKATYEAIVSGLPDAHGAANQAPAKQPASSGATASSSGGLFARLAAVFRRSG